MIQFKKVLVLYFLLFFPAAFAGSDFQKDIKPLLDKYCFSCHGPEKQKAKLRMDTLNPNMLEGHDAEMWQEALDLINISDMPPEKSKAQPTRQERQLMVEWMTGELRKVIESKRSTGGKNVMRRLTAYEYNNTLKDLLKLDLDFAKTLPHEGTAKEGFKNNNSILGTSALHIEYFEMIGRNALEKVILVPEQKPKEYSFTIQPEYVANAKPKAKKKRVPKKSKRKKGQEEPKKVEVPKAEVFVAGKCYSKSIGAPKDSVKGGKKPPLISVNYGEILRDKGILLAGNRDIDKINIFAEDQKKGGAKGDGRSGYQPSIRLELVEYPYSGPVKIRIKAAAVPGKGGTYPRLSWELGAFTGAGFSDQREGANIEVKAPMNKPQVFEFTVMGENFPFRSNKPSRPSYFRIFNDFRRGTSKIAYKDLPKLFIDSIEITCNAYEAWPPTYTKNILIDSKNKNDELAYASEIIKRFMNRAYRRPVAQAEIDRKVQLFKKIRPREGAFKPAIVSTLTAVLCSPHFLMITEPHSSNEKRKLNNYELASRLSYFLWSSMPDDTLFRLATQKKLTDPEVLRAQVKRMVNHPRSSEFVRNFTSQWLDLEGIHRIAINPEYFDFPTKYKPLFAEESIAFVDHVLKKNMSIENFIHSDFAVINPIMARLYRIPEISGGGFQAISLKPENNRGGLLTQASILFANSTGSDTHPIKRGVWLLERLLDDPPPPPPPAVPDLPEPEEGEIDHLSLKERLIVHAETESCNDCHSKIDPWGVAFENYNALGQWREGSSDPLVKAKYQKVAIDPSTKLKNGRKIKNLMDLKSYILNERKNQLTKAVVNKVLSYSIGRYLEFSDQKTINDISEKVAKDNLKFQSLIEHVVLSEPFLTK